MAAISSNPKLRYMDSDFDTHFKVFHELMSNKVMDILLVASAYDAYILEEDGSLASRIINEYRLSGHDERSRQMLKEEMERFFFGGDVHQPDQYRPE